MEHDLIVFAEDWGGLPSSTQHLIKQLAKSRKVVWINSIGLRQPTFSLRDVKRAWAKLTAASSSTEKNNAANNATNKTPAPTPSQHGFHVIHPRTIPAPRSGVARYIAKQLLLLQIKPIIKSAQLTNPILWTSLPTAVDFAGQLNETALVYYCGDDFSGLTGVDHHTVVQREQALCEKADLIMASSQILVDKLSSTKTQLLTHGVDYSLFSTPCERAQDLPNDGRPIAGFYGSISAWLDIELLQTTIEKMPNWHFIFIGNIEIDASQIKQLEQLQAIHNVSFLGPRAHHQLPTYSQHWTASMLPFIDNAQIQACNPLKLKEYLATGRPIISTKFAAIKPYTGLVQIAESSDAMVEALQAAQHLPTLTHFTSALQSHVQNKSWASRAQQVSEWLEQL